MESVPMGAILKVGQAIMKAERTVRRNKARCEELAQRARQVAELLPSSKAVARGDAAAASILIRLKSALDDALELVESCGRRRSCLLFSWPVLLLTSGGLATKFADVNTKINNCLLDLQTANGVRMERKIDTALQLAAHHGLCPHAVTSAPFYKYDLIGYSFIIQEEPASCSVM